MLAAVARPFMLANNIVSKLLLSEYVAPTRMPTYQDDPPFDLRVRAFSEEERAAISSMLQVLVQIR